MRWDNFECEVRYLKKEEGKERMKKNNIYGQEAPKGNESGDPNKKAKALWWQ